MQSHQFNQRHKAFKLSGNDNDLERITKDNYSQLGGNMQQKKEYIE